MSLSRSKAARVAALKTPKASNPAHVNRFDAAFDVAMSAVGLKKFTVVVPSSEAQAHAGQPMGEESVEYGHRDAIEPRDNAYHPKFNPRGRRNFADVLATMNLAAL